MVEVATEDLLPVAGMVDLQGMEDRRVDRLVLEEDLRTSDRPQVATAVGVSDRPALWGP